MGQADHSSFHEQFVRHQSSVYGYIASMLPRAQDAEEVFSQTSLVMWRKWDTFDHTRHFLPWARAIAYNEIRNYLRRIGRTRMQLSDDVIAQLAATQDQHDELFETRLKALRQCVDGLEDRERTLLDQCYGSRGTIKQIAAMLGLAPATVYMRLHRMRQFLHECIDLRLTEGEGGK